MKKKKKRAFHTCDIFWGKKLSLYMKNVKRPYSFADVTNVTRGSSRDIWKRSGIGTRVSATSQTAQKEKEYELIVGRNGIKKFSYTNDLCYTR